MDLHPRVLGTKAAYPENVDVWDTHLAESPPGRFLGRISKGRSFVGQARTHATLFHSQKPRAQFAARAKRAASELTAQSWRFLPNKGSVLEVSRT